MSKVNADYFPRTISQYVPNMQFAADVVEGKHFVSLGAPSTADPDGILDGFAVGTTADTATSSDFAVTFDGSATHIGENTAGVVNGTYGRCLSMVASAGADHVLTVSGRDYLGQKMSEVFTLTAAVTIFGKKAFKYFDSMAVAAGGQAGDTVDVGWYDRLGLPYKAEKMITYTEDDVSSDVDPVEVLVEVDAVRYAAGADVLVVSPVAGQITGVHSVATTASTGTSTSTVVVGTTNVAGLSIVILASTVGDLNSDIVTTDNDQATSTIAKFGAIGISPDATPSAGAANFSITVEPLTFIAGVDTDPQTTSTTDPRGTIRCTTPCDASIVYEVGYTVDTSDLHGVEAV